MVRENTHFLSLSTALEWLAAMRNKHQGARANPKKNQVQHGGEKLFNKLNYLHPKCQVP